MDCAKLKDSLIDEFRPTPTAHAARVQEIIGSLSTDRVRRLAGQGTTDNPRVRIARCLLSQHPGIDSVESTDPGTALSYRITDSGRWHNVLLSRGASP